MTEFGIVTQMGRSVFLDDQPCSHPKCGWAQHPKIFGTQTYTEMVWPRAMKCGTVTRGTGACYLGDNPAPIQWGGPSIPNFLGPLPAQTVWPGVTKFGQIAHMGNSVFLGRQWRSHHNGTSIPNIYGTSYMRAHSMRNNNHILHGDQTRCEEILYMINHGWWHDLFAIANLLVCIVFIC